MSKLNIIERLPPEYSKLFDIMLSIQTQVNTLSEGYLSASYTAQTAAPTTGNWSKGDFVRNSNPSEAGSAGSKYVLFGWECVTAGNPGTWKELRCLTGG